MKKFLFILTLLHTLLSMDHSDEWNPFTPDCFSLVTQELEQRHVCATKAAALITEANTEFQKFKNEQAKKKALLELAAQNGLRVTKARKPKKRS
jgi:hypothetical protein